MHASELWSAGNVAETPAAAVEASGAPWEDEYRHDWRTLRIFSPVMRFSVESTKPRNTKSRPFVANFGVKKRGTRLRANSLIA